MVLRTLWLCSVAFYSDFLWFGATGEHPLVPRESILYQGTRGFPGARLSVLLHPEEVQPRKRKQSSGSREDSAKPHPLSELKPRCGCTPKNAVDQRKEVCEKNKSPCQMHEPCAKSCRCY